MAVRYRDAIQSSILPLIQLLLIFGLTSANAQINFGQSNLNMNGNGALEGVTSLTFGPDGRLYVAEYPGTIKVMTVQRIGLNNYVVTAMETLNGVKNIVNHNDDGVTNGAETNRETIGLAVAGTASNPVIYISSSDFRIGAGTGGGNGDVNLDTNSGILTRFSWNGSGWAVVDLVRGLPRSEENHATNGLEFVTVNGTNYLLVAQGGHTNGGAPSTNFVYTCEYALSAAILSVNLDMLNTLPEKTDSNGRKYLYDLPTLDDPTRANVNGVTDPNNPGYTGVDVNDPFGGNDGLNQAIVVPGGPVQIFSPGYRNSYDLVVTQQGAVFVTDNGANGGWGGFPVNEGTANVTNNYDPSEPGSQSATPDGEFINNRDHLQLITTNIQTYTFGSYYGGHPNPTRANPSGAGLYTDNGSNGGVFRDKIYDPNGSTPGSTTNPNIGLPANWSTVVTSGNPVEGDWRGPGIANPEGPDDNPVTIWGTNTNGIDEYTASNFGGTMKGNLIAGVHNGVLRRVELNTDGSLNQLTTSFASGLGGNALGVTCNSDSDPFPGTIWAGTLNGNIIVLEPADLVNCLAPGQPGYNPNADYDSDGYTNKDEADNGTDPCNGGSQPEDFDKSAGAPFVSNLTDTDDDNDGILDQNDPFQLGDPTKTGSDAFSIPVLNGLFNDQQGLGGIFGLGMTGLMNNGSPNPNWLQWIDRRGEGPNPDDVLGGAPGLMTSHMTSGTANGTLNTQEKGYQYGVKVNQTSGPFTVAGRMINFNGPLRLYGNTAATGGELGYFIGDGTQQNFIKFVINTNGLSLLQEINDVPGAAINIPLAINARPQSTLDFYFVVDPATGQMDLEYAIDGAARILAGKLTAQGPILTALQQNSSDLAVGFIGTSNSNGVELEGTWDYLNVTGAPVSADVIRINAGGTLVNASDTGSNWQANNANGSYAGNGFSVNTGRIYNGNLIYANRHISIPSTIDQNTYTALFAQERYDVPAGAEMKFSIPLPNGNYEARLFMGDGFSGTSQIGARVFDILMEGIPVRNNLDLIAEFGYQAGGMLSFPVSLTDGILEIEFLHETENPIINAIEIVQAGVAQNPITVNPIANQAHYPDEALDGSLGVVASGGDGNLAFSISGQPQGVFIEPTNGQIGGTISSSAMQDSPYSVTVTVDDTDGVHTDAVTINFTWTILGGWNEKNENETYTARHENSFVQAGDKFYLMGGRESARTIDVYNYTNNSWTSLVNSAPLEFNHFQATEYQGLIWVIGAFQNNAYPTELPAEYIWAFDPVKNTWIQGPQIPAGRRRGAAGLVIYNDKFYIAGGNTAGHNGGYVAWFDEFDPATGIWNTLVNAPRARDHFAAVVIGTKLYLAGGRLSGGTGGVFAPTIPQVDVYDFNTSSWSTLPAGQNIPTQRAGASAVNFNNRLVVIGGEVSSQTTALKTTEEYDPVAQSWRQLSDLNFGRHGTQAIVSGTGIFILGGSPNRGGGNQKNMEYLGDDVPVGIPGISSTVSAPSTAQITNGTPKTIDLAISNGNLGVMVTNMVIQGPDAVDFNIVSGKLTNQLLSPNSIHPFSVGYTGSTAGKTATLKVTYGATDEFNIQLTGTLDNTPGGVSSLTLINANSDIDLYAIEEGMLITTTSIQNIALNIRANTNPQTVGSVFLSLSGPVNRTITENVAPYALFGDSNGNYAGSLFPVGSYTITATAYSSPNRNGTVLGSLSRAFEVIEPGGGNQPPLAVATANPLSGTAPLTVNFTGSNSQDDQGIVSYSWDFKDSSTSGVSNPVHTFNNPGTYIVSLQVTDGGGLSDTATQTITVNTPSTSVVTGFTLVNSGNDTDLLALSNGMQINGATVQGLQLNIRANTNPQVVGSTYITLSGPLNRTRIENTAPYALLGDNGGNYAGVSFPAGNYTLNTIAYSGANRGGTILGSLQIEFSIGNLNAAKGLTGLGEVDAIPGSKGVIPEPILAKVSRIQIYPNPARDQIHITHPDPSGVLTEISLFDLSGKLVQLFKTQDGMITEELYQFDLNEHENGVYLLHILTDNNHRYVLPLVLKR